MNKYEIIFEKLCKAIASQNKKHLQDIFIKMHFYISTDNEKDKEDYVNELLVYLEANVE